MIPATFVGMAVALGSLVVTMLLEGTNPLAVKGVDAPVQSYLVLRAKPRAFRMQTRGVEGVETRMIGRDAELAALQAAFARVVAPGAGLERIVVVSEAGVGKSRLLHEFESWSEARPERCILFQARATPQTRGQAYGLLRDLFAWRWQILDGDPVDVARRKLEDALVPLLAGGDLGDLGDAAVEPLARDEGQRPVVGDGAQ